jgi:lysophospholipase L1-like esterase
MHWVAPLCLAVLAMGVQALPSESDRPRQSLDARWVASWAVAPLDFREVPPSFGTAAKPPVPARGTAQFRGQTLRQQVRPTLDGERARVRFSNRFGKVPLRIAAASLARSTGADAISPATLHPLSFGGRRSTTIAPGAEAWSDGVDLEVEAGQTLAVSTFLDRETPFATVHQQPRNAAWVVGGNAVATPKLRDAAPLALNHIVTGLDVLTTKPVRTVVAFGDSITEGAGGTEAGGGSYPDQLAMRLRDSPALVPAVAVINMGIGGNRLLVDGTGPSGISRFGRDALGQSGVTHVMVLIGTNDIGRSVFVHVPGNDVPQHDVPTTERIIEGLQQLINQAHAKGVKVLLATVPPFKGVAYWTEDSEAMRGNINRWIRGLQDVDGVIDFDAALRSPADPMAMNPLYDSGDHLHPNSAGYAAMAAAVDLREIQE